MVTQLRFLPQSNDILILVEYDTDEQELNILLMKYTQKANFKVLSKATLKNDNFPDFLNIEFLQNGTSAPLGLFSKTSENQEFLVIYDDLIFIYKFEISPEKELKLVYEMDRSDSVMIQKLGLVNRFHILDSRNVLLFDSDSVNFVTFESDSLIKKLKIS